MITKQDCLLLLGELRKNDIPSSHEKMLELLKISEPTIEIIKFINNNRPLDVSLFYEKLRRSYNDKKSNLYINLVRDIEEPTDALITLASLQLQILLFAKNAKDRQMFLRHSRAEEISLVLNNYFKTYDITPCLKLLKYVKADLKCIDIRESYKEN